MGVREIDRFLEQWQMDARDLHRQIILSPTPRYVRETADVPVIFLSAYGQDQVIARAFDMGAADYVVKPFSPAELAARIRAALRRPAVPVHDAPVDPYVLGDDADEPAYIFTKRRAGYWMEKGETPGREAQ